MNFSRPPRLTFLPIDGCCSGSLRRKGLGGLQPAAELGGPPIKVRGLRRFS